VEAQHFKENSCCQNVCRNCGKVFPSNCLLKLCLADQKKCAGGRDQIKLMMGEEGTGRKNVWNMQLEVCNKNLVEAPPSYNSW